MYAVVASASAAGQTGRSGYIRGDGWEATLTDKKHIGVSAGILFASILTLVGCGPRPVSTIATVHFETATTAELTEAANVLLARFREMSPSRSSSCTAVVGDRRIVLEFRGEPPADEIIRGYASSQGIFHIYPADARRNWLVSDRDVQIVNARASENGEVLDLSVDEDAAQRLLQYTSRNLGAVLVTSWDGKEQTRATVRGVFSKRFQTTGMDRDAALRMMITLRSGRLPVAVREVEITHPPTGG